MTNIFLAAMSVGLYLTAFFTAQISVVDSSKDLTAEYTALTISLGAVYVLWKALKMYLNKTLASYEARIKDLKEENMRLHRDIVSIKKSRNSKS